jgi:uncharacterized protein (DUF433 family)
MRVCFGGMVIREDPGGLQRESPNSLTAKRAILIREQANVKNDPPVVHSDPEIMSGTPVFVGTRVPFQTLLDYLEAGDPLGAFLEDFPTVSREQVVTALEQAKQALLARENLA